MTSEYEKRICSLTSDFIDSCLYEMETEYRNTLHMVDHIKDLAKRYFPTHIYGDAVEMVLMAQQNGIDHVQYPGCKFTSDFPIPFENATDDFDYFIKVIENDHFDLKGAYEAYVNLAVGFLMGRGTTDFENPSMGYINQAFLGLDYTEQLEHSVDYIIKEGKMFNWYKEQYKHGFENFVRRMREMDDFTSEYHNTDKWPRSARFNFDGVAKIFNFIKWACQLNMKIFHSFSNAFVERMLQYKGIYDAIYVEFINKGIIKIVEPEHPAREHDTIYNGVVADTQPNPMEIDIEKLVKEIQVGKLYQHFKGREYRVLSLGKHSETGEYMVTYQALYGDKATWVRPLTMWFEEVKPGIRRFRLVEDEDEPKKKE